MKSARLGSTIWDHSTAAYAAIAPHILSAATLMDIRVIVDSLPLEKPCPPKMFSLVRRPRSYGGPADAPICIAYVHATMNEEWLPDDAAWFELLSQLWPGY